MLRAYGAASGATTRRGCLLRTAFRRVAAPLVPLAVALAVVSGAGHASASTSASGLIAAVGAENEYANVISQIGGRYVSVTAVESNPNTDPHTFEASPSVARLVSSARIVVQNGVGYDSYMDDIETASANAARKVIDVQKLLGLPDSTPNPHLWYAPTTMPAVAKALAADLSAIQPAHASYFQANATKLRQLAEAVVRGAESVRDALPEDAGGDDRAGRRLHARGGRRGQPDPVQFPGRHHERRRPRAAGRHAPGLPVLRPMVKVFLYNQQVTDTLTESFISAAKKSGIPVVGVYETMPTRLRLPVVDARRGERAGEGGRRTRSRR